MSRVIIRVWLSDAGRKDSILRGGSGAHVLVLDVPCEHPLFADIVKVGSLTQTGVVLELSPYSYEKFDTVPDITAAFTAYRAKIEADERAAREAQQALRDATEAVLRDRKTLTVKRAVGVSIDGDESVPAVVFAEYAELSPDWPYNAVREFVDSDAAKAWMDELATANAVARDAALTEARAKLPAIRAEKEAAARAADERAAARLAKIVAIGGEDGDLLLGIEDRALTTVPPECWESHKRGKNWLASIVPDPTKPGGLNRAFMAKARGSAYYIVPTFDVGTALEFGADYYSGSGRKSTSRWYGFVVGQDDAHLVLRECAGGKTAYKSGQKFAATLATA